jgi:hypothetical protein
LQALHQLDFDGHRDWRFFILQAVAWTDIDKLDVAG